MIKFYFQYDKDRKKAKVVLNHGTDHEEVFYTKELCIEVPIYSRLQEESPMFVMCGECSQMWYNGKIITLTNHGKS